MAYDRALVDWTIEATEPLGHLASRPMMGGALVTCDGLGFAIVVGDALWFKADAVSDAAWDAEGCARFTYQRGEGVATMNFRRAPDDVYDDADAMRRWATLAIEAAARVPRRPKRKR